MTDCPEAPDAGRLIPSTAFNDLGAARATVGEAEDGGNEARGAAGDDSEVALRFSNSVEISECVVSIHWPTWTRTPLSSSTSSPSSTSWLSRQWWSPTKLPASS